MNIYNIASQIFSIISSVVSKLYDALFTSASDIIKSYELPWLIEEILQDVINLFGDFSLLSLFLSLAVICIILTFLYRFIGRF